MMNIHLFYFTMESTKEYPKVEVVATKEDFKYIRLQLCEQFKKKKDEKTKREDRIYFFHANSCSGKHAS